MLSSLSLWPRRPRNSHVTSGCPAETTTRGGTSESYTAEGIRTPAVLPEVLQHPEFRCPSSGLLLTDPVLDAHGRSYQRGKVVGGALVPRTGVDPQGLPQPVMEDRPTRSFVAGALAGEAEHSEAFQSPILLEVPREPVVWRGEGIDEWHVYERAETEKFFAQGLRRSPTTGVTIPAGCDMVPHRVAAEYAARLRGHAVQHLPSVKTLASKAPTLAPRAHLRALGCVLYGAMRGVVAGCVLDRAMESPWSIPTLATVGAAVGVKQSWTAWNEWSQERRDSIVQQPRRGDLLV